MDKKSIFEDFHCPRWEELPQMDLYMDQLVTLLNGYLTPFTTEKQGKKITSTMINNYVKHGIVHVPVRKRYTKEHVAYLIVVCILKSVYSLEEISTLIQVQIEKCPQELAYNYFCTELENCLSSIFKCEEIQHIPSENVSASEVVLICNTLQSVAYTVYVREVLK